MARPSQFFTVLSISLMLGMSAPFSAAQVTVFGVIDGSFLGGINADDVPFSYSTVLGAGSDGLTTYLGVQRVNTLVTVTNPTTTEEVFVSTSVPVVFAENASRFNAHATGNIVADAQGDVTESCVPDDDNDGFWTCGIVAIDENSNPVTTDEFSVFGLTQVPLTTLVGVAVQTPAPTAVVTSGFVTSATGSNVNVPVATASTAQSPPSALPTSSASKILCPGTARLGVSLTASVSALLYWWM